ncbi:hypothetical protein EPA93_09365 [Ktedonosporobacter rubrisoli]|uniref:Uncharacterized protein n=1 Tax=Ktedonosporobacter rubrisoli TaxID=2509675 RepID=A0A4P6JLU9_KTERU|nr:hypothetical protein [Ktedonosporobacter rubrisoli]QBD76208.1 hypothetical protein EPA93_09365 [Ktedonosporobacter rubrisoli]
METNTSNQSTIPAITVLLKADIAPRAEAILRLHGCLIDKQGGQTLITFPFGTTRHLIPFSRTRADRYRITLPDGQTFKQVQPRDTVYCDLYIETIVVARNDKGQSSD